MPFIKSCAVHALRASSQWGRAAYSGRVQMTFFFYVIVQLPINICSEKATGFSLNFSTEKFGIAVFNDSSINAGSIQRDEIPSIKE